MSASVESLISIISSQSVSPCGCRAFTDANQERLTDGSFDLFINYAREHDCAVSVLHDDRPLDDKWEQQLENLAVTRAVPPALLDRYPDSLCVFTGNDLSLHTLKRDTYETAVVHLSLAEADLLPQVYCRFFDRFKRINVSFVDLADSDVAYINRYKDALIRIDEGLTELLFRPIAEINRVVDPLILTEARVCGAGNSHLSMGPDGTWYICPSFYFDVNMRNTGKIKSPDLNPYVRYLDPSQFSLCANCECHHCSRCVYYHKKYTGEFSTPPAGQCMVSHFELVNAAILGKALRREKGLTWPRELVRPHRLDPLHRSLSVMNEFEKELWACVAGIDSALATQRDTASVTGAPVVSKLELDEIVTIAERISGLQEMLAEPMRLSGLTDVHGVMLHEMKMELCRLQVRYKNWWIDAKRRYVADSEAKTCHVDFQTGEISQKTPSECYNFKHVYQSENRGDRHNSR